MEHASIHDDHDGVRDIARDVVFKAALKLLIGAPLLGNAKVVLENFEGPAVAEIGHAYPLFYVSAPDSRRRTPWSASSANYAHVQKMRRGANAAPLRQRHASKTLAWAFLLFREEGFQNAGRRDRQVVEAVARGFRDGLLHGG